MASAFSLSLSTAEGRRSVSIENLPAVDGIGGADDVGFADINGDGIDDALLLGMGGKAAVIFGGSALGEGASGASTSGASLDVDALGSAGKSFTRAGLNALAAAGDVNGDGIEDFILGHRTSSSGKGNAYVIYGAEGFELPLNVTAPAARGFRIFSDETAGFGNAVAGGGDFNGDGFDDVVVGAVNYSVSATNRGAAYVIFGSAKVHENPLRTRSVSVKSVGGDLGTDGLRILGDAEARDYLGHSVAMIGDVNGDGFDDIAVGADGFDGARDNSGIVHIIFGRDSKANITISSSTPTTSVVSVRGEKTQPEAWGL